MTSSLGGSAERADFYDEVMAEAKGQPATTFTDDVVYEATTQLIETLTAQLLAASHVRGARPKRRGRHRL